MSNKQANFNETIEEAIQTYKAINSETLDAHEKVEHIDRHLELEERRKELREKL
ncbi:MULTISPECIES: hypothetical protein [Lysinibacillus]|uniref:hypothetical protein n=1 Tax=Lysinibacillus TaxID=400634 RepID=UPI000AA633C3|nr:hypothetical protein [Lysinibacillus sphaericus]